MQDRQMVVKGLECCLRAVTPNCKECPYKDICYRDCICKTMVFHAQIVIHEQQAEIEQLKGELLKAKGR